MDEEQNYQITRVDLNLLDGLSNVNDEPFLRFLKRLIQKWVPQVWEAIENTAELPALTAMMRIGDKSLDDIFGKNEMNWFRAAAKGYLLLITSVEQKRKMLLDIVIILCLLACIYDNFKTLQWGLVLVNSEEWVISEKSHVTANKQVYINLLEVLRLLVPDLEVDVVTVASRIYYFDS